MEILFSKAGEAAKFEWIFLEMAENVLALVPLVAKALSCILNCMVGRAKRGKGWKLFTVGKAEYCFFILIQKQLYWFSWNNNIKKKIKEIAWGIYPACKLSA